MMKMKLKCNLARLLAVVMVICMGVQVSPTAVNADAADGHDLMLEAARGLYQLYQDGAAVDGSQGKFGGYEVYVMQQAEIDPEQWVRQGVPLTDELEALVDASVAAGQDRSKVKRIAADYLGALVLGESAKAETLLDNLIAMQGADGRINSNAWGEYSDLPAYDYLTRAGVTSSSGLNIEWMVSFIDGQQTAEGGIPAWSDFLSTTQGVKTAARTTTASALDIVSEGRGWLDQYQQANGSYTSGDYDDVVVDTSEMILLAEILDGEEITDWDNSSTGKDAKDYMLNDAFAGDTFGQGNVASYAAALDAYRALGYDLQADSVLGLDVSLDLVLVGLGDVPEASVDLVEAEGRSDGTGMVTWSSTDTSVATVDANGDITPVSAGETYIKASYDGLTDKKKITVSEDSALLALYGSFMNGTPVDGGQGKFSSYELAVMKEAGVDLSDWVYEGDFILDLGKDLIEASVADPDTMSAKRLAQDAYLAKLLGQTDDVTTLVGALVAKHTANGNGGIDGSIYSDAPAYENLLRAGLLLTAGFDLNAISNGLIDGQDISGGWPVSDWGQDFVSSAQSIRVLEGIKESTSVSTVTENETIDKGLQWLRSTQQDDGSYLGSLWDDVVVDTAEVIYTAIALDEDPAEWENIGGKSPVDYYEDQTYDQLTAGGNTATHLWAFDTFNQLDILAQASSGGSGDSSGNQTSEAKVYVAIIDKDGDVAYGPSRRTIEDGDEGGMTVYGALVATGYLLEGDSSFVSAIDLNGDGDFEDFSEANAGNSGWKYAVNGRVPMVPIGGKDVESGDEIILYYSTTIASDAPDWPETAGSSGGTATSTVLSEEEVAEVEAVMETHQKAIEAQPTGVAVLGLEQRMTPADVAALAKEMKDHTVDLAQTFDGSAMMLADKELSMMVPAGASDSELKITAEETEDAPVTGSFAVKVSGAVYEFGPSGTKFDEPVTISIKVAIGADVDISRLTPAWYDEAAGAWVPIPGVIDFETGMVTFETDHFSKYALIEKEARVAFADVNDSVAWAVDAIEILAGEGIIHGTGDGFEPGRSITRAEFVKIMIEALGYETFAAAGQDFTDVSVEDWFAPYVEASKANGMILGYPDGSFKPNATIMRSEVAAVLGRMKTKDALLSDTLDFEDADEIHSWAEAGVRFAVANDIIVGDENGNFGGGNDLTRAEAAVVVYRYLNYLEK